MGHTQILIFVNHSSKHYRNLRNKLLIQKEVTVDDVLATLLPASVLGNLKGVVSAGAGGQSISYKQRKFEADSEYLQFLFDLLCNLASAYPLITGTGGSAVPALYPIATDPHHKLQPYAESLLRSIATKTAAQLGWQKTNLLCPQCLVYCGVNKIELTALETVTFYGCRSCSQSDSFRDWKGQIVAVLDNTMAEELVEQNNVLTANWLIRRKLFDFDEVHIIRATDEDVERFAVQIGNDTDEIRKQRYPKMHCNISTDCQLSANTRRILQHTFGQINTNKI
jgi:hypothetical protein